MPRKKLTKPKAKISTQKFLDITEIKENCVVLKDGTLRAVILVSSINFALKSEDEQNAIIAAYMSFLNSFDFPLQIVIQSRKLDIEQYLERLKRVEKEQPNELLRMQTAEYHQYVVELVEMGDIMTKRFYVVVPYNPLSDRRKGFWKRFSETFSPTKIMRLEEKRFKRRHRDLFQRVNHIITGLQSVGLNATILDTQSLIELYYNTYNPEVSNREKLTEVDSLRVEG